MSAKTPPLPWNLASTPESVLADQRPKTLRVRVPDQETLSAVLAVVSTHPHHRYLLTADDPVGVLDRVRDAELAGGTDIWVGVEADDRETARAAAAYIATLDSERVFVHVPRLRGAPCPDTLRALTEGDHWLILGSADSTPMHPDWVRAVRDACLLNGTAFRFESWGTWVENADVSSDEYVVRVPREISPTHCAIHTSGRVALCPDNPDNPFRRGEEGWTVLRRVFKDDPALVLIDGKDHSEEPFLSDEPDIPENMLNDVDDEDVGDEEDIPIAV